MLHLLPSHSSKLAELQRLIRVAQHHHCPTEDPAPSLAYLPYAWAGRSHFKYYRRPHPQCQVAAPLTHCSTQSARQVKHRALGRLGARVTVLFSGADLPDGREFDQGSQLCPLRRHRGLRFAILPSPCWSVFMSAGQSPSPTVCRLRQAGRGGPASQPVPSTPLHSSRRRYDSSLDAPRRRIRFVVPPCVTHDGTDIRAVGPLRSEFVDA